MRRLPLALASVLLLSGTSCRSTTLDITKLRKPVMMNSHPADAGSTKEHPEPYTGTSWIWTGVFPYSNQRLAQYDASINAETLFAEGWRTISGARIKVSSESSFPILAISQYVGITVDGEAHK